MNNLELAKKYFPHIMFDKAEPFDIDGVGYSIYAAPSKSSSFRRDIYFNTDEVVYAIEYAIYFDYDIQHLYDLEHIWIFVGHDGKVVDAEASFHGFYLKAMTLDNVEIVDDTHLKIYCQPGKHAFMSDGNLFKILPDWFLACNMLAGTEGFLVMDMFKDFYYTDEKRDKKVTNYIKKHFSFEPTLEFEYRRIDDKLFYTWDALRALIPVRINEIITIII